MLQGIQSGADSIIAKLESIFSLSDYERSAIWRLPMQVMDLEADEDIAREGRRPRQCCALLEGWAGSYKVRAKGKRQILAFHIAGDIPDLQSLHLRVLDSSIQSLTPCRVGLIEHWDLRELCLNHPRVADAFWRETLIDGAVSREGMLNVGRREAYARTAHLLCELVTRMRAVGLTKDGTYDLPITEVEMGDAMCLSAVQTECILEDLRAAQLISLTSGSLVVLDWPGLQQAGEFDSTYLHLRNSGAFPS